MGLALSACDLWKSDFPESAVAFTPPPQYRAWWQVVESCAGKRASFDGVSWYTVEPQQLVVHGDNAAGAWFAENNSIVVVQNWVTQGSLVRHEMLHAILETGDHPIRDFNVRCADEVICGRECLPSDALPGAREVSVDVLHVEAVMFPPTVSLGIGEGKATIVVRVRNPTSTNIFVRAERFGEARCAVGFVIASIPDSRDADLDCQYLSYNERDSNVYFRAGETQRLLFDVDLRVPAFGRPLSIGAISISAIIADSFRETAYARVVP